MVSMTLLSCDKSRPSSDSTELTEEFRVQTDRWGSSGWPSWLAFIGQNHYSNLDEVYFGIFWVTHDYLLIGYER